MADALAHFESWAAHAWLVATSPLALRAYTIAAVAIAYAGSGAFIAAQISYVANLKRRIGEGGNVQALIGDASVQGRVPTREESRAAQMADLRRRGLKRLRRIVVRSMGIVLFGIVVPLSVLAITSRYYDFMFPGSEPLTDARGGRALAHPAAATIAGFALEQLYLASPGDTLEIAFDKKPSVGFDRSDKFFMAAVWANRILCESSVAALIFLLTQGAYYAARPSNAEAKRTEALKPKAEGQSAPE